MTKDEVLKLALEALEEAWYHVGTFQPTEKAIDLYDEARTAIKEALAQPEQEPVAWADHGVVNWIADKQFKHASLLYTIPPQRTWLGLTDAEIKDILDCGRGGLVDIKKTEAKLKEKNNG